MVQGQLSKHVLNHSIRKESFEKDLLNASTTLKEKKNPHKKTLLGQNLDTSTVGHRRHNSSVISHHSRLPSNDRKSSHAPRSINMNNSLLNNSSMLDDAINYSKEYSYLKECDTSELVPQRRASWVL